MAALPALLRNPSASFWASLPSRSTQRLLFPYLPLKHCLALWHSLVSLSHSADTYFLFSILFLPGIEYFSQNVYVIFFPVVFPLFRSKEKGVGDMTKRHFQEERRERCLRGREKCLIYSCLLCCGIEMSSVATVIPSAMQGICLGERESLLQRKQISMPNWNISSFQIVL